jgi:oligo-1,6-glucosidase
MLHEAKGVGDFLGEMRDRTFKPHHAFTVGEVFNEKPEELPDFIGENGYFSTMFDFAETVFGHSHNGWHECIDITPDDYRNCVFETQEKVRHIGFISNIIENHDEPRGVCRYIPEGELSDPAKKMLATLYFLVRGLPWIYQGQELGMENISVSSIEEVDDISSLDSYKVSLAAGLTEAEALRLIEKNGRDNARTPYQWSSAPGAGFTTGTPWLRINPNYKTINLEDEKKNPDSVYHYYKKLIALRKDPAWKETLVYGELVPWLADTHNVMAYTRKSAEGKILVIANYQTGPRCLPLPAPAERVLLNNYETADLRGQEVFLQGYQVLVLALSPDSQT